MHVIQKKIDYVQVNVRGMCFLLEISQMMRQRSTTTTTTTSTTHIPHPTHYNYLCRYLTMSQKSKDIMSSYKQHKNVELKEGDNGISLHFLHLS